MKKNIARSLLTAQLLGKTANKKKMTEKLKKNL